MSRHTDLDTYERVILLRERGMTFNEIGEIIGFSKQRANDIYHKAKKMSNLKEGAYTNHRSLNTNIVDPICKQCGEAILDLNDRVDTESYNGLQFFHKKCWKQLIFKK